MPPQVLGKQHGKQNYCFLKHFWRTLDLAQMKQWRAAKVRKLASVMVLGGRDRPARQLWHGLLHRGQEPTQALAVAARNGGEDRGEGVNELRSYEEGVCAGKRGLTPC